MSLAAAPCSCVVHTSWLFPEGAEIASGRSVLKTLGGGSRYEALLVWEEALDAVLAE